MQIFDAISIPKFVQRAHKFLMNFLFGGARLATCTYSVSSSSNFWLISSLFVFLSSNQL